MILIDPDLDPDSRPPSKAASPLTAKGSRPRPWRERLPTPRTLERFLRKAQGAIRLRGEVTVLFTTDREIRRLNREFRSKNKATDVLSFPADQFVQKFEQTAGDLAISVDTARKQSAEQGHALTCELQVLILHGLLHLAGYDHETDSGEMARWERRLRARFGLSQGLIERSRPGRRSREKVRAKTIGTAGRNAGAR